MIKNIKLKIEGMHCKSCAMVIKMGLEENIGIVLSKVSFEKGNAEVSFDDAKLNEQNIIDAITKTGYTSQILTNLK